MERDRRACVRLPALQRRRLRRRDRRGAQRGIADARSLSRRPHGAGARTAAHAGIFPRRLFACRYRSPVSGVEYGLADAARQGGDPDERYASDPGRAGAHAHSARRGASRLGRGVGHHAPDARLHQPYAAARGARALAGRVDAAPHSAPSRDHLRDQPPAARGHSRPLSRRHRASRAHEPDRGRPDQAHPHGESGHRRLPQHQWRGGDPLQALAHDDGARPRRGVSRAIQQQDQRRHAETLASTRQSVARGGDLGRDRRGLDHRPRRAEKAHAPGRRLLRSGPTFSRRNAPARRGSPTGSSGTPRSSSTRIRSSTARSSAFTSTSGSCSTR